MTTTDDLYDSVMEDYADQHRRIHALWDQAATDPVAAQEITQYHSLEAQRVRESDKADNLIQVALDHFEPGTMTSEDLIEVVMYAGRIYGPRALFVLDMCHRLHPDAYRESVPHVWSLAEFPGLAMDTKDWRRLWKKVGGFVIDGEYADRPTEPVRLYRGAQRRYKAKWSWTDNRERAEWFVNARRNAHLFTVLAPPEALVAHIHEEGRHEDEWVLDTRGLRIEEVPR